MNRPSLEKPLFKNVCIIGLGLIGGSLALDIRERGLAGKVIGSDTDEGSLATALERGIVEEGIDPSSPQIGDCDLVVLAVPVLTLADMLEEGFEPGTLVTDVGSVKGCLIEAFQRCKTGGGQYRFVPGHPIAGDEKSGPTAARTGLFEGAKVILTPIEDQDEDVEAVASLWAGVGSRVETMDHVEHDAIFAWVSHLPHMAAYGIVNAVLEKNPEWVSFSGGGLKDYTRIAASSPRMWADIALANREFVLEALRGYSRSIESLYDAVSSSDRDTIEDLFRGIARVRRDMK